MLIVGYIQGKLEELRRLKFLFKPLAALAHEWILLEGDAIFNECSRCSTFEPITGPKLISKPSHLAALPIR